MGGLYMEYLLKKVIKGIEIGQIYGMIEIGYKMVYGIIGMIKFDNGDILMIGELMEMIVLIIIKKLIGMMKVEMMMILMMIVEMIMKGMWRWEIERVEYKKMSGQLRIEKMIKDIGMQIELQKLVKVKKGKRKKKVKKIMNG